MMGMADHRRQTRQGFSLIEVLVVLAIMAALMGLTFAALSGFRTAGERRETASTLQNLQNAYTQYRASVPRGGGSSMHIYHDDPERQNVPSLHPDPIYSEMSSLEWFIYRANRVEQSAEVIATLGERLIYGTLNGESVPVTAYDSWGSEIIFWHRYPGNGVTPPDHDSLDLPIRPNPYFASPGPSGDFYNEDDNVYSFELGE